MSLTGKIKITWIQDSAGRDSIHVNGGGTMEESYLGHITRVDDEWFFVQKGVKEPHGPFRNMGLARREAMLIVNGEYV
jgi:hypothetical protein